MRLAEDAQEKPDGDDIDKGELLDKGLKPLVWSLARQQIDARLWPTVRRWWENPLVRHARHLHPMPLGRLRWALPAIAILPTGLMIVAWAAGWRFVGAALVGISLGAVLLPMLVAPVVSADRVARQMLFSRQDPRRLTDLDPGVVAWGLALVTLWRLRWPIVAALVFTPAMLIGAWRLDLSGFLAWQETSQALGVASPAGEWLLPGGRIPYLRLVVRAVSLGLLPWAMLPLAASAGITAALLLHDPGLSPLAALLGEVILYALIALLWDWLTHTTTLAGGLEIVRLAFLILLLAGLLGLVVPVNAYNAGLLARSGVGDDRG